VPVIVAVRVGVPVRVGVDVGSVPVIVVPGIGDQRDCVRLACIGDAPVSSAYGVVEVGNAHGLRRGGWAEQQATAVVAGDVEGVLARMGRADVPTVARAKTIVWFTSGLAM
jgi:hypothetical protein